MTLFSDFLVLSFCISTSHVMQFPHAGLDWISVIHFLSIGISLLNIVIHSILVQFGLMQGMRDIHLAKTLAGGKSPVNPLDI